MTIIVAALAGTFGLAVGLMVNAARAGSSRVDLQERNVSAEGEKTAAPTLDSSDLPVVHPPAIGRARVYYTSYPGVDVLEAVLSGLRRL
ncbi:hypothetical protein [Salinispora mooreana]|uniref:hypothetical protein n=1 Tax=Salinispora mooreana TaxID=999545 RepID=UPI000373A749|nr:hypothetical protein [Salinispora mooreana]